MIITYRTGTRPTNRIRPIVLDAMSGNLLEGGTKQPEFALRFLSDDFEEQLQLMTAVVR